MKFFVVDAQLRSSEFVVSCVIWAPSLFSLKPDLVEVSSLFKTTNFCFLIQAHFHHFLHKKVSQWWDSKEGGNAVVCDLINSGNSDLALFSVLG